MATYKPIDLVKKKPNRDGLALLNFESMLKTYTSFHILLQEKFKSEFPEKFIN